MRTPTRDRIGRSARLLLIAWVGVLSLFVPTVAYAITNGTATDDEKREYDNVGSLVMRYDPDGPGGEAPHTVQLCTGTLVSSTVVLTASHCMQLDEIPDVYVGRPEDGQPWFTLDDVIDESGDGEIDGDVTLLTGTATPHELYAESNNYRYDVGAFVLDTPIDVTEVAPAELAPIGYLDDKSLRGSEFVTVGYGIVRETKTKSTQSFLPPRRRMKASQPLVSVTRDFAHFSMSLARDHGGTCYGDSGGPHFNSAGEIVATTTTGDIPCKASDRSYRTDTKIAHDFLSSLGVPVPVPAR